LKSNRIWLSNRMFWPQPYADSIKWIFDTIWFDLAKILTTKIKNND
jgi:hypothetical protein